MTGFVRHGSVLIEGIYCYEKVVLRLKAIKLLKTGGGVLCLNIVKIVAKKGSDMIEVLLFVSSNGQERSGLGTVLHWAAQYGSVGLMKTLLKFTKEFQHDFGRSKDGITVLMCAAMNKNASYGLKIMTVLMQTSGNINATDANGFTALLHLLNMFKNSIADCTHPGVSPTPQAHMVSAAEVLLSHGADAQLFNMNGDRALDLALALAGCVKTPEAKKDMADMARLLLAHNSNPSVRNGSNEVDDGFMTTSARSRV